MTDQIKGVNGLYYIVIPLLIHFIMILYWLLNHGCCIGY